MGELLKSIASDSPIAAGFLFLLVIVWYASSYLTSNKIIDKDIGARLIILERSLRNIADNTVTLDLLVKSSKDRLDKFDAWAMRHNDESRQREIAITRLVDIVGGFQKLADDFRNYLMSEVRNRR